LSMWKWKENFMPLKSRNGEDYFTEARKLVRFYLILSKAANKAGKISKRSPTRP
jgi:hypothetical protein